MTIRKVLLIAAICILTIVTVREAAKSLSYLLGGSPSDAASGGEESAAADTLYQNTSDQETEVMVTVTEEAPHSSPHATPASNASRCIQRSGDGVSSCYDNRQLGEVHFFNLNPHRGAGGGGGTLRVAVEMSGQMRTFRGTFASCVERLLKPNDAKLFIATYPYVGNKRWGARSSVQNDEQVTVRELSQCYGSHLCAVYMARMAAISLDVERGFAGARTNTYWSWMLCQLLMVELAHAVAVEYATAVGTLWDVVVRFRADLYVIGPVTIRRREANSDALVLTLSCENDSFATHFGARDVVRTPHHPRIRVPKVPFSDHSFVGFSSAVSPLLSLYTMLRAFGSQLAHNKGLFKKNNNPEILLAVVTRMNRLGTVAAFGWHAMLRNETTFFADRPPKDLEFMRRKVNRTIDIFSTDNVPCPLKHADDQKQWQRKRYHYRSNMRM